MKLTELTLRYGTIFRRSSWPKHKFGYSDAPSQALMTIDRYGTILDIDVDDVKADDWEIVKPDWLAIDASMRVCNAAWERIGDTGVASRRRVYFRDADSALVCREWSTLTAMGTTNTGVPVADTSELELHSHSRWAPWFNAQEI